MVMPIGGHEDKTDGAVILNRFIKMARGKGARIAIIAAASTDAETGKRYEPIFREMGAERADVVELPTREAANSDEVIAQITEATGIFISGGDQTRLVEILAGTRLAECIRERNAQGVIVAGTSAGASIISAHMMDGGGNSDTPRKGMVNMIAGFGLAPDMIIDQHFSQRGRIGRLLASFAASPGLVGLGIDENTAAIIGPDGMLEVIGENSVTIVDGRNVWSDYFDVEDGDVLTITNSSLHILKAGRSFDLERRTMVDYSHTHSE
jgi:cyanophycinase